MTKTRKLKESNRRATTGKISSTLDKFAQRSDKIDLVLGDLTELIEALKYAAKTTGEHVASEYDPYGEHNLSAKTTRIFNLITALARELEQQLYELKPEDRKTPSSDGVPGELLKELLFRLPKKLGKPHNVHQLNVKHIVGSTVKALVDVKAISRNSAIKEVKILVEDAGLTFKPKTVAGWEESVAPDSPVFMALQLLSEFPSSDPKRALISAARHMIQKAG